jgi:hypothetical protein
MPADCWEGYCRHCCKAFLVQYVCVSEEVVICRTEIKLCYSAYSYPLTFPFVTLVGWSSCFMINNPQIGEKHISVLSLCIKKQHGFIDQNQIGNLHTFIIHSFLHSGRHGVCINHTIQRSSLKHKIYEIILRTKIEFFVLLWVTSIQRPA